jgi:uncharacterized membrane protein YhhN
MKRERLRRFTKVPLMPLLALAFSLCRVSFSAEPLPWTVIAALLLGCAGDTLLLNHHHPVGMPLGLAAFSAGHALYTVTIWRLTPTPAWWLIATLIAVYGGGVALIYKKLRPYMPKAYRAMGLLYMLLISTMGASAAADALTTLEAGAFVLLVGTLLFMLSDSILSFEIFRGETRGSNLKVMIPYIAAQTFLATGFWLQLP